MSTVKVNSVLDRSPAVAQFVQEVRRRLDELGWSVSRLAEEAEMGRPYVQNMLAGKHDPSVRTAEKLCKVLGLKIRFEQARRKSKKTA